MGTNSPQLEILLLTGTSFSSRLYLENDDTGTKKYLSEKEKIQDACWNGILNKMLPELFPQVGGISVLYLWKINEAISFLDLVMGESENEINGRFSVDPYLFLQIQSYN